MGRTVRLPHGVVRRPPFIRALGLLPPYSESDVKKAYRDKAARLHPDAGGDPEAFKALHTAYRQALEYAQFHESRRHWLGARVETYVVRDRVIEQIRAAGGTYELGPIDEHLEEFGRDFCEVLRELIAVEFSGAKVADESLGWVESLGPVAKEVRTVALTGTRITTDGLLRLDVLSSIRALDLRGTRVSIDGLEVLHSLPSLEWLHLGGTGIGYFTRRHIRREFPRIHVVTKSAAEPPADSHWDEYLTVLRRLENL